MLIVTHELWELGIAGATPAPAFPTTEKFRIIATVSLIRKK